MEIAKTIIQQLGGAGRLQLMTGANMFVALKDGVAFKIKNRKINYIKIILNGKDLYDVYFYKLTSGNLKLISEHNDIYFDELIPLFEKETGMYLTLFAKGGRIKKDERTEMILSQLKQIHHHEKELQAIIKKDKNIEPWVIAKMQRAVTDLGDVTHYEDGKVNIKMAKGGGVGIYKPLDRYDKIKAFMLNFGFEVEDIQPTDTSVGIFDGWVVYKKRDSKSEKYYSISYDDLWYYLNNNGNKQDIVKDSEVVDEDFFAKGGNLDNKNLELEITKNKKIPIADFKEASLKSRKYIEENDLGMGDWLFGNIYSDGRQIAYVSYNGRIWKGSRKDSGEEILFAKGGSVDSGFQVGEKGLFKTRKGDVEIEITGIGKNWVYINVLETGKKRDIAKAEFIEKFRKNSQQPTKKSNQKTVKKQAQIVEPTLQKNKFVSIPVQVGDIFYDEKNAKPGYYNYRQIKYIDKRNQLAEVQTVDFKTWYGEESNTIYDIRGISSPYTVSLKYIQEITDKKNKEKFDKEENINSIKNKILKAINFNSISGGELNSFGAQMELVTALKKLKEFCNKNYSAENKKTGGMYYGSTPMYSSQRGQAVTIVFNSTHHGDSYSGSKPFIVQVQIGGALSADNAQAIKLAVKDLFSKFSFDSEFGKGTIQTTSGTNWSSVMITSPTKNNQYTIIPYFNNVKFENGGSVYADGGIIESFVLQHNDLSRKEMMNIGLSKGDLMKMAYGENTRNIDSALPMGLLEELGISNDERYHYVMDYQGNSLGKLTDLFDKIEARNPVVEIWNTDYEKLDSLPILEAAKKYKNKEVFFQYREASNKMAKGGGIVSFKKGDKVMTRDGKIETILRKNKNGNYETEENDYTHSPESLELIEKYNNKK